MIILRLSVSHPIMLRNFSIRIVLRYDIIILKHEYAIGIHRRLISRLFCGEGLPYGAREVLLRIYGLPRESLYESKEKEPMFLPFFIHF